MILITNSLAILYILVRAATEQRIIVVVVEAGPVGIFLIHDRTELFQLLTMLMISLLDALLHLVEVILEARVQALQILILGGVNRRRLALNHTRLLVIVVRRSSDAFTRPSTIHVPRIDISTMRALPFHLLFESFLDSLLLSGIHRRCLLLSFTRLHNSCALRQFNIQLLLHRHFQVD